MFYSSHTNIASSDDESVYKLIDSSLARRDAWSTAETYDNVIVGLQKKLLESEHTREDQLWMKNEEMFNMKMELKTKEEQKHMLSVDNAKVRETILDLMKEQMDTEHNREDQLWMKNEEVTNLKMLLKENDELIEKLTEEMENFNAAHLELQKKMRSTIERMRIFKLKFPEEPLIDEIIAVNGIILKGDSIHSAYDKINKILGKVIIELRSNPIQALLPKTQYAL